MRFHGKSVSILCVLVDAFVVFQKPRVEPQTGEQVRTVKAIHTQTHPLGYSIIQVLASLLTTKMASFSLPPIYDNEDKSWGPSSSTVPKVFQESV